MEDLAVPVFLGGPQIVPAAPEAVVPQVHSEQPVEVGQALFGQEVQRQRCPGGVGNTRWPGPRSSLRWVVGAFVGCRAEQIRREPELALPLVSFHELADRRPRGPRSTSIFEAMSRAESVTIPMSHLRQREATRKIGTSHQR